MKILIRFNRHNVRWMCQVVQELDKRLGNATIAGLVQGGAPITQLVAGLKSKKIDPIIDIDKLEAQWLATPCDYNKLERCEADLIPGALRRIIIADREMGVGYLSTGLNERTTLTKVARDHEMVRRYAFGLVEFLMRTFEEVGPDLVFTVGVSHAVPMAMAEVAEAMGIPFAQLTHCRVGGYDYVVDDSPIGDLYPVKRIFQKALTNPSILERELTLARDFLSEYRSKPTTPAYSTDSWEKWRQTTLTHVPSKKGLMRDLGKIALETLKIRRPRLRSSSTWENKKFWALVDIRARRLARKGPFQPLGGLPNRPFVFYPLHIDPESSTMVASPMHTDQMAIVEALSKSLPLGMDLVVKEHFPVLGQRPRGFYKRLSRMPGVVLASPFESSLSLIQQAGLTCVITGTAAWEAILLRRPALIIGSLPFMAVKEGFVFCPDLSRLPQAVKKTLALPPASDETLELYVAALYHESFELPYGLYDEVFGRGDQTMSDSRRNEILSKVAERMAERFTDLVGRDNDPWNRQWRGIENKGGFGGHGTYDKTEFLHRGRAQVRNNVDA